MQKKDCREFKCSYGFSKIFEKLNYAMVVYEAAGGGRDFIIRKFNKTAEKIEKIRAPRVINKNVSDVFPGVKKFGLFSVFKKVYKTGRPAHFPVKIYKDQRISGWRDNYIFKLPCGEIVAIYSDETKNKQEENELEISELSYRRLFETAQDGILLINFETGMIEDVNPFLIKMLGYSKNKFLKRYLWEIGVFQDIAASKRKFLELQNRGNVRYENLPLETKNGKKINVEFVSNSYGVDGKRVIQCNIRDITDRKKIELALHQREEEYERQSRDLKKFKQAVDNASDHIIITDKDGVILYANKAVSAITGYSFKEIIGKRPSLWGLQMPKEFYETFWKTIKYDRKDFVGEIINKRKSGALYNAEIRVSPIFDEDKKIIYFVGIEHDITKIKEADRAKNEFVSIASHQLRTPLTVIKWLSEILLQNKSANLTAKQIKSIQNIYDYDNRMIALVNDLLNVSRIEAGAVFKLILSPVVLNEFVQGIVNEIGVLAEHEGVKLFYKNDLPKNFIFNLDATKIKQVLSNLLTNAIKYAKPKNGSVELLVQKSAKGLLFSIKDDGIGIPKIEQPHMFERFFRGAKATLFATAGTGLGLYIVKSLVESHGGNIWFESKEGVGTTFYFFIPKKQKMRIL